MIVTVNATVMDGTVVRWYRDADDHNEIVSASRNGVLVYCLLHEAEEILPAARAAYEMLRADRDADLSHLATHRRATLFSAELVEVTRG